MGEFTQVMSSAQCLAQVGAQVPKEPFWNSLRGPTNREPDGDLIAAACVLATAGPHPTCAGAAVI